MTYSKNDMSKKAYYYFDIFSFLCIYTYVAKWQTIKELYGNVRLMNKVTQ